MESTWRGLDRLISGVEIGESLEIHVLDVTKDQLRVDLLLDDRPITDSVLYRLLVESGRQTAGGQIWSALVADITFGPSAQDVDLLAALGAVAAHAGGPLLAGASPSLVGCEQLNTSPDPREWAPLDDDQQRRWDALRTSPLAPWIGLALPRVLCRLPYGSRGEEIDAFPFDELTDPPQHEALLWGNPAVACLMLLARSALHSGWPPDLAAALDLDSLPALTVRVDGEVRLYPCGEVYLAERAVDELLGRGLMPLVSFKNRNAVRLVRFQSIADPPAALRFS
jgi:type VI secretion system protein ImpC